jgi:hypothetical protein
MQELAIDLLGHRWTDCSLEESFPILQLPHDVLGLRTTPATSANRGQVWWEPASSAERLLRRGL